jgi:hypothetical protein
VRPLVVAAPHHAQRLGAAIQCDTCDLFELRRQAVVLLALVGIRYRLQVDRPGVVDHRFEPLGEIGTARVLFGVAHEVTGGVVPAPFTNSLEMVCQGRAGRGELSEVDRIGRDAFENGAGCRRRLAGGRGGWSRRGRVGGHGGQRDGEQGHGEGAGLRDRRAKPAAGQRESPGQFQVAREARMVKPPISRIGRRRQW